MRLLIVSNMSHYLRNKTIVGWGPAVQEIDHLSHIFEDIRHIGCLHNEPAPAIALPYESSRVTFIPVPPSGGHSINNKLDIARQAPYYLRRILEELPSADAIHVRCPANISLLAILLLACVKKPTRRWVKYAGNWNPSTRESYSYTFQRWLLKRNFHRGTVTVNGNWTDQPPHVHSFINPCLTDADISSAHCIASKKKLSHPIRLLFVGRLDRAKGVGRALEVLSILKQRGINARLDFAGDGPEREIFRRQATSMSIESLVNFHGWVSPKDLLPLYDQAHIMLFPSSSSEGWPKALSEGMAYGVVPIAGAISSIPEILSQTGAGVALPLNNLEAFADVVQEYLHCPQKWKEASLAGVQLSSRFTYSSYLEAVRTMFRISWDTSL